MKTELITVPTFTFNQGELGGIDWDYPIQVSYYNNGVELIQEGNSVVVDYAHLNNLFKEIKKHLKEAKQILDK